MSLADDAKSHRTSSIKGVFCMAIAILIYSITDCFMKHTVMTQFHLSQVLFIRAFIRLIPMLIIISFMPNGPVNYLKTHRVKAHLIRLFFAVANASLFSFAIKHTCLVNVYTMSYTTAIFTTASGYFFLKEKVDIHRCTAVFIGMLGVMIALQPQRNVPLNLGSIIALCGAFFAAMNKTCMKNLSATEHSITIAIYPNIMITLLCLPFALFFWQAIPANQLFYFVIIGILSAIAQYLIVFALSLSDSSALAPLDYTSYVWASILDFLTMGIIPESHNFIGATIIALSGLYVYLRARQQS